MSSGSHTSSRPPPKPKVFSPIDSSAQLPVKIIRSAHEIFRPYFCLTGQSSLRALSRLALSGQLFRGAKRCVPRPPDEQRPVVAVVGRPPVLRRGHHRLDVPPEGIEVEGLELLGVVEVLA